MRLEYRGEYPLGWRFLSDAVMASVGYRCVRCSHPFDPTTRKPLICDGGCDLTKGPHRNADPRFASAIKRHDDPRIPGLNYGVHHFDGDKSNNRWWNLMPLCNCCHLKVQSSVIPERQWLFEHTTWAKPYIAGFYAFWFAQLDPTKEQVEDNLDQYLAMGQPWLYRPATAVAS